METVELKINKDNIPSIDGKFEFIIGECIHDPYNFKSKKLISFAWSIETQQDIEMFNELEYNKIYELIGDKLKIDFINFIKNQK
jgi:hypothetical protein